MTNMKCFMCGGSMVMAIRDKDNILYECTSCGETSIEHVYTPEEELNKFREIVASFEDDLKIPNDLRMKLKEET